MPEFFFYIKDNKIANPRIFKGVIGDLPDGGYRCRIEKGKKRSNQQNAWYWGIVVHLVKEGLQHIGYREVKSNDDAHEILKALFLKRNIVNEENGEVITIPGSTQKLTTIEFMTYTDEITKWAAEYLGVTIPAPNEQLEFFNEEKY